MRVSVVVPALNEETVIAELVAATRAGLKREDELFVVDGGSRDATAERAAAAGAIVIAGPRGRGRQMNVGAERARGDVLVFLHADTRLPDAFRDSILASLADGRDAAGWGRFDLLFDEAGPLLRAIAWLINHRSRWTRGATGDQALFVRADLFRELGGYREPLLFEDVELCRRLKRVAPMAVPDGRVVTSSRRWRAAGVWRTTFLMWGLKTAYLAGVPAARLARFYSNRR